MSAGSEVLRALAVLCESPDPAQSGVSQVLELGRLPEPAEYTQVFGLQVVPYAAVYLGPEGMLGGQAADRIAGFWRALGYAPPPEPDHLAALLGLYAQLTEAEESEPDGARRVLRRQARAALLWEHLLTWVSPFTKAVNGCGSTYYSDWAALLAEVLAAEAAALEAPASPAQHLRSAPELPAPEDGVRDFARALLAPVRSGLVLTRPDLVRAGRELGLGARVGERAFVLRSLLEQDAVSMLGWLAAEADRWAEHHQREEPILGPIAGFWRSRAETTAIACRMRLVAAQEVLTDAVHT